MAVGLVHNVFWTEPKGTGIAYAHVRSAVPLWHSSMLCLCCNEAHFPVIRPVVPHPLHHVVSMPHEALSRQQCIAVTTGDRGEPQESILEV